MTQPLPTVSAASPQPQATPPVAARFQWSQIESSDYPTYIANLRAIRCPEQTIRDIITADIGALFDQRCSVVRATGGDPVQLAQELNRLRQEQSDLLVRLLGPKADQSAAVAESESSAHLNSTANVSPTRAPASSEGTAPSRTTPVLVPLALLAPDPAMKLSSDQKAAWETISQDFIKEIGGPNQNPSDPEYIRRWMKAQPTFDERFKAVFGDDEFVRLQARAAQQSAPAVH